MKEILSLFFSFYEKVIGVFLYPVFLKEKKFPNYKRKNERPVEYSFAFRCLAEIYPDTVLDVGTGTSAFPHLIYNCGIRVTSIDKISGYWKIGMSNRHTKITNDDITNSKLKTRFDLITCISVLEHIPNHNDAVKGMFSLLNTGGHLLMSFPYNEHQYHPDIYKDPGAGYGKSHKFVGQVYSRKELNKWLHHNNAEIIKQEYYEAFTGDLWTMGTPIYPIKKTDVNGKHHLTCLLVKKKL